MKGQKREAQPVPKLCEEVKALNGKSSRKLSQSIENLHLLLDEPNENKHSTDSTPVVE